MIAERGDSEGVPRHPAFRLFGAMNPATDAGGWLVGYCSTGKEHLDLQAGDHTHAAALLVPLLLLTCASCPAPQLVPSAGKRDLPAPLRNRFTEIWVGEPPQVSSCRVGCDPSGF